MTKSIGLIRTLKQALRITENHERLITEYENCTNELIQWINKKIDFFKIIPNNSDCSLSEIQNINQKYQEYLEGDKPKNHILLYQAQGVLSRLTASQKRYNRPLYRGKQLVKI